jgi:HemY protein
MLRALWFLIKISLLVAGLVWFIRNPGAVEVRWQGYVIDTSIGFVATVLALLAFLYSVLYRVWSGVVALPRGYQRYRAIKKRELGYRNVTAGFVAVAAGDGRTAERYAGRANTMIPDAPLTRLLAAQSYLLNGNAPRARAEFSALLKDDSAAFFGIKGLLQESLHSGDYREALQYIRKADALQPRRAWIARTLFDLETRNHEWARAQDALKKAGRLGVFRVHEILQYKQVLFLAEADEVFIKGDPVAAHKLAARAFDLNPAFTPAALRLAGFYENVGKKRAMLKVIEKAWGAAPHPELAALWMKACPPSGKISAPYVWAQKLYAYQPDHREALRMLGAAAVAGRQWREARDLLMRACDYPGLAQLEKEETGSEARVRAWLEAAAETPPGPRWICTACGHVASRWQATCSHCGSFGTVEWTSPDSDLRELSGRTIGMAGGIAGDILSPRF